MLETKHARLLLVGILFFPLGGCDAGEKALPPVQVESLHFRYHAGSASEVQSDILDRLERSRTDVLAYLGRDDEDVIDYYLFPDRDSYLAAAPCGPESYGCEENHEIFSNDVMSEHELIHAYVRDIGFPPIPILEGTAEGIGCLRSGVTDTANDWQSAVEQYPPPEPVYGSGRRLVRSLLDSSGVARFADYYGTAVYTRDPALFALQFQQSWSEPVAPLWSAVNAEANPPPARCPCMADPVAPDGTNVLVSHPNASDYRPIAAGTETVLVTFSTNTIVGIQDCLRETTDAQLLSVQSPPASLALLRLDPPNQYFMDFELPTSAAPGQGASDDSFTATGGMTVEQTCTTASALTVGSNVTQLAIAVPHRTSSGAWYVPLTLPSQATLYRADMTSTSLDICPDCASTCAALDGAGSATPISGQVVLRISPDASLPSAGLATVNLSIVTSGSISL